MFRMREAGCCSKKFKIKTNASFGLDKNRWLSFCQASAVALMRCKQNAAIFAAYFLHRVVPPPGSAGAISVPRSSGVFPVGENVSDTDNLLLCATCVEG